jgi:hypothetical protein
MAIAFQNWWKNGARKYSQTKTYQKIFVLPTKGANERKSLHVRTGNIFLCIPHMSKLAFLFSDAHYRLIIARPITRAFHTIIRLNSYQQGNGMATTIRGHVID